MYIGLPVKHLFGIVCIDKLHIEKIMLFDFLLHDKIFQHTLGPETAPATGIPPASNFNSQYP